MNPVPTAYGDDGRATPPPLAGFPPKYTQAHFEEVRSLTVTLLMADVKLMIFLLFFTEKRFDNSCKLSP